MVGAGLLRLERISHSGQKYLIFWYFHYIYWYFDTLLSLLLNYTNVLSQQNPNPGNLILSGILLTSGLLCLNFLITFHLRNNHPSFRNLYVKIRKIFISRILEKNKHLIVLHFTARDLKISRKKQYHEGVVVKGDNIKLGFSPS